jgi:hypothetical protein
MKDVRLNNGTMMTDEQFVMERGMGDTITDFVATKADLELLAQALVNRLLFDEFVLMQQGAGRDIAEREYTDFRLGRVMDYLPELRSAIEEKLRLGNIQNEADVKQIQRQWPVLDVIDAETDLGGRKRDMSDRQRVYQFIVTVEGCEGDDFNVLKFDVAPSPEACNSECPPCKRDAVRKVFDALTKTPDIVAVRWVREAARRCDIDEDQGGGEAGAHRRGD